MGIGAGISPEEGTSCNNLGVSNRSDDVVMGGPFILSWTICGPIMAQK